MSKILGVLGGMGPLATVDFLQKLIEETPATRDQDHIPVIAYSVPQVPDRPRAIAGTGESPLPHMLAGIRTLKSAGAQAVAIACNTAHYWYDDLVQQGGLPVLHIADAACAVFAGKKAQRVGLIATQGTAAAGFSAEGWWALGVMRDTPLPEVDRLERWSVAALGSTAVATAYKAQSFTPPPVMRRQELDSFFKTEIERYRVQLKRLGLLSAA